MKKQTWKIAAFVILGIGAAASFLVVRPMESKSPPLRRGMFEWQEERVGHFTAGIKIAGRIVGVTNQDGTRTFMMSLQPSKMGEFLNRLKRCIVAYHVA